MNCLVGGDSLLLSKIHYFKKNSKNNLNGIIFLKKLEKYLEDIKFSLDNTALRKELFALRKIYCGTTFEKVMKDKFLRNMVYSEVFYQENFLLKSTNGGASKRPWSMNKRWKGFISLVDNKYGHYIFE